MHLLSYDGADVNPNRLCMAKMKSYLMPRFINFYRILSHNVNRKKVINADCITQCTRGFTSAIKCVTFYILCKTNDIVLLSSAAQKPLWPLVVFRCILCFVLEGICDLLIFWGIFSSLEHKNVF